MDTSHAQSLAEDSKADLRKRMFNAAARMRNQRIGTRPPEGVTHAEAFAIMVIARMERAGQKARPGDVARQSNTTPSAISQTLKSLEAKGLVTRQRDKDDCRTVTVSLTETGCKFDELGRQAHERMIGEVLDYLGPKDASSFVRIVERLADFADQRHREHAEACTQAAGASHSSDSQEGGTPCA